jgi:type IV pilus assembly protein PilV
MHRQLSRGFTLIEVLVTLVILTFGLLGIAGLMAKSQRLAYEAYQRQQAVALATDMAERIRGNRTLASVCPTGPACTTYIAGAPVNNPLGLGNTYYTDYRSGSIKDCASQVCSNQELALYDLALWDGLLNGYSEQQATTGNRVGGIINARGCIEELANTFGACPPAPAPAAGFSRTLRITVAWQGNDDTAAPTASNCGINLYGAETKRRIITYDQLLQQACP